MIRLLIFISLLFLLNYKTSAQPGITIINQTMPTCTSQGSIVFHISDIPPLYLSITNTTCLGTGSLTYVFSTTTFTINNIPSCDSNYVFLFSNQIGAQYNPISLNFSNQDTCLALFANNSPVYCQNACQATATVTGLNGTPPYSYTWMPIGVTTPIVSSVCPGSYTIIAIDANGKTGSVNLIILNPSNPCVGIEEFYLKKEILIYPNPVSNILHISPEQYFETGTEIEILNTLGQTILKLNYTSEIDVSALTKGYYTFKLIPPNKSPFYSKFIKE